MSRDQYDFFPTPTRLIRAILNIKEINNLDVTQSNYILEPGAGTGNWGREIKKKYPYCNLTGIEINPVIKPPSDYDSWYSMNFLDNNWSPRSLIVCNPPYGLILNGKNKDKKLAEKFVSHSWECLSDDGLMVFLLRLGFLGGQNRYNSLFSINPPRIVYALPKRPQFIVDHQNDQDFAVYVWDKTYNGATQLDWLEW